MCWLAAARTTGSPVRTRQDEPQRDPLQAAILRYNSDIATPEAPLTQSTPSIEAATIRGATVTTEDGGRLNAFATEPRMEVVSTESGWGFHERAEKLNGRMAMLGFIALLATEFALGGESFTRGLLGIG
jgi:hypothetical protein